MDTKHEGLQALSGVGTVTLKPERESVINAALELEKETGVGRITQAATNLTVSVRLRPSGGQG